MDELAFTFYITAAEYENIKKWQEKIKKKVLKKNPGDTLQPNEPYFGAIGGGLSYTFEPTGMGDILTIKWGNG